MMYHDWKGLERENHFFDELYPGNGGMQVKEPQMAAHETLGATNLYDRTTDQVTLDEVERIVL